MLCMCMGRDEFARREKEAEGSALCRRSSRKVKSSPGLGPMEVCYSYAHADSKGKL